MTYFPLTPPQLLFNTIQLSTKSRVQSGYYLHSLTAVYNIMGDKLLLNFGAKFQR